MQPEQQIKHTLRYLRMIEAKANVRTRRYLRRMKRQDPSQIDATELLPIVRDMMLLAFMRGYEQRPLILSLSEPSPFDASTQRIIELLEGEGLGGVAEDFGINATQELAKVNQSLQPYINTMLTATSTKAIQEAQGALVGVAENRIKTVMRTATHTAHGAAHYVADQDPAVQSILWGYKYVTAGDERVRPEHAAMDGVTAPKEDPIWDVWWPPNGWNCRCILVSIFKEQSAVTPEEVDGGQPMPDPGFVGNPAQILGV